MSAAQEHYNTEYASGTYADAYSDLPEWAVAVNLWHVDFAVGLLALAPERGPVLDLGSGMGHFMTAWERRGYTTRGRDISDVAIRASGRSNIDHGDATDLSGYADDQFQLVFSAAFLEHVDDDAVRRMLRDAVRIAPLSLHYIGHARGADEGHINVKSPDEWTRFFAEEAPHEQVISVVNPLVRSAPAFLLIRDVEKMPRALVHAAVLEEHYARLADKTA